MRVNLLVAHFLDVKNTVFHRVVDGYDGSANYLLIWRAMPPQICGFEVYERRFFKGF